MSYKHISGWVNVTDPDRPTGPVDPGYGRPDWGGRPDNSLPGSGGRPDNSLPGAGGRPDNSLPIKPPGRPIIPVDPSWGIPVGPPQFPGDWVPVDPGYGLPPILGWRPVDPGFGVGAGNRPDQGLPGAGGGKPDNSLPPGHWVPTDPDYGLPARPCGGDKPVHPIWVWIAEIGPDFGLKPVPPMVPKPTPK